MLAILTTQNDETGTPRILYRIGGQSLLERHARLLKKRGLSEIVVLGEANAALVGEAFRLVKRLALPPIRLRPNLDALLATLDGENDLVLLDGACLYDERLLEDLTAQKGEAVVAVPADALASGLRQGLSKLTQDGKTYAIENAARLSATRLAGHSREESGQSFGALLAQVLQSEPTLLFDVSQRPTYSYELRRHEPYLFLPIHRASDNAAAKHALLNAAQKSVLDWPAWYLHRPIEKFIIYHLCEWPITPNQLTVLNNVVAFLGVYLFASGHLGWALVAALSVGVLDGLDGKQARVKVMTSKVGRLEEVFDKIYENGWYLAMAYWLSEQGYGLMPYIGFALIFFCNMADIIIGLVFTARRGRQLDDYGPFERRFRLVSGRRNTYIWTLVPFVAVSLATQSAAAFFAGFATITVYALLTVAVRRARLVKHLCEPPSAAPAPSESIRLG